MLPLTCPALALQISLLTVEEKVSLLSAGSPAISRLGLPAYSWAREVGIFLLSMEAVPHSTHRTGHDFVLQCTPWPPLLCSMCEAVRAG